MPDYIYVIGRNGKPQMPTKRKRHVQKLLNTGKARIAGHVPFTIQLLYDNTPVLQPVTAAEDPGRTNIGVAAVGANGELYFSAIASTRNKEIRKLMSNRRMHRRASRSGERKARQRLAKRFCTMLKAGMAMRKLPAYGIEKYITCKYIRNTEAKFCNRKRHEGWVTPTVEHLICTHINLIHKLQKFLPVSDVAVEVNRFAFLLLENPTITGVDFQNGPLKGFDSVKEAVSVMQHGECLLCKNPIVQYHHILPKSKGGSDTLQNLAGMCDVCHTKVHTDGKANTKLQDKKKGLLKKYAAQSAINQSIPFICQRLEQEFGKKHVYYCSGVETSILRGSLGFTKTKDNPLHEVDAYCIGALAAGVKPGLAPDFCRVYQIQQFRRQDRSIINNTRERTYYLDGETVAKNRKCRFEQRGDSLDILFTKIVKEHGLKEAESMRSRLSVKKSTRYYNTLGRVMPGAVFYYKGERKILSGQFSKGQYYRAIGERTNYPARDCRIIKMNEGLVFVG